MAHIGCVTIGVASYLNTLFWLADKLSARGHQVSFIAYRESAAEPVRRQGYPFILLEHECRLRSQRSRNPLRRVSRLQRLLRRGAATRPLIEFRRHFVEGGELDGLVAREKIDALILDYELQHHIVQATGLGIPLLLFDYQCSSRKVLGIPPLSSSYAPEPGPRGLVRSEWIWWTMLARRWLKVANQALRMRGWDWWSTLHRQARRTGFDMRRTSKLSWHYLTFLDLPTLILAPSEFDFPGPRPMEGCYIGPLVSLDRRETGTDPGWGSRVESIRRRRAGGETRLVAYCSLGSMDYLHDKQFLERVARAFEGRSDWELVIACTGETPETRCERVHVFGKVPQLEALAACDVFLTHGGQASLFEAVELEVPMVLYSAGSLDQNGNVARAAYHGMGVAGDPQRDAPADIEARIAEVHENPRYREGVRRMKRIVERYRAQDPASIVERFLGLKDRGPAAQYP